MITLTEDQAEQIRSLLNEYYSAMDNHLYQFMGIPERDERPTPLERKLNEIDSAITLLYG